MTADILAEIDDTLSDWESDSAADAMRWSPGFPPLPAQQAETVRQVAHSARWNPFAALTRDMMITLGIGIARAGNIRAGHDLINSQLPLRLRARHLRRCRVCNPGPRPLCINGAEYHRRQKSRRR